MKTQIESIKQISIKSYLAKLGINAVADKGYYGMYRSPFREDTNPSLKVDYRENLWYDFGADEGGTIVDLVMKLEKCSMFQAIKMLENGYDTAVKLPVFDRSQPDGHAMEITDIKRLEHPALIRYIMSRGINVEIAKCCCAEVHYRKNERKFFAVGFANDSDGWEFRNATFKGSFSPKDITTRKDGYDNVLIFEGFMDFLSFLSLKKTLTPPADVVVLNSTANLKKALPFLREHRAIMAFLDNDEAGRGATADIARFLPEADVRDFSQTYAPCKDLNDYLLSRLKR